MTEQQEQFDPRRAKAGQRFTGQMLVPDPEAPADHPSPRMVQREVTIRADDEGVVRPRNAGEAALLDRFDLPVARKAIAEDKAATAAKVKDSGGATSAGSEGGNG